MMSLKICFFVVAFSVALCYGKNDTSVKTWQQIREEAKVNFGQIKQNIRDAAKSSRDFITNIIKSLIQFKIDTLKTFINYKKTKVQNFIKSKMARIDAIREKFEKILNKNNTQNLTPTDIDDEKEVIITSIKEIEEIKKSMEKYLKELNKQGETPSKNGMRLDDLYTRFCPDKTPNLLCVYDEQQEVLGNFTYDTTKFDLS